MDRRINTIKNKARSLGIENWQTIKASTISGKRAMIISPKGKTIHFGQFPYNGRGTYLDHKDDKLRSAFRARHSVIKQKDGSLAYKDPESPSYYAYRLLW